jgi:hypothetical protein
MNHRRDSAVLRVVAKCGGRSHESSSFTRIMIGFPGKVRGATIPAVDAAFGILTRVCQTGLLVIHRYPSNTERVTDSAD